jgi:hypothetical protein
VFPYIPTETEGRLSVCWQCPPRHPPVRIMKPSLCARSACWYRRKSGFEEPREPVDYSTHEQREGHNCVIAPHCALPLASKVRPWSLRLETRTDRGVPRAKVGFVEESSLQQRVRK